MFCAHTGAKTRVRALLPEWNMSRPGIVTMLCLIPLTKGLK